MRRPIVREVAFYRLGDRLGVLGFCEAAPRLLLGAVGGVFVDRYDCLRLLTGIQFLCCLPVLGLVLSIFCVDWPPPYRCPENPMAA